MGRKGTERPERRIRTPFALGDNEACLVPFLFSPLLPVFLTDDPAETRSQHWFSLDGERILEHYPRRIARAACSDPTCRIPQERRRIASWGTSIYPRSCGSILNVEVPATVSRSWPMCDNRETLERCPMNMKLRAILWTATMAYFGFLWVSRGVPVFNSLTISGAVMGAVVGLLLALMFARRAKRKRT